jgi:hypothetical protein
VDRSSETHCQLLKTVAIIVGLHLPLGEVVQFTLKMHSTTGFIAIEEVAEMNPDHVSSGAVKLQAYVHQILRDSRIEPVTNKKILGGPLNVSSMHGIVFDMVKKIEAAKHHKEQGAPLGVVVRLKIQVYGMRDLVATL